MELVVPSLAYLDGYADALRRGWSADNIRLEAAAREELDRIADDPQAFVASLDDREAKGAPITLPDGSTVARLPGFRRWMWDGAFCGSIGLRWQPGTRALPPYVLGHIGYAVVPWKRGRGHATQALAVMLEEARREGLPYVELILGNGGVLVERFHVPAYGKEELRFHISLS
jgi:predicted acetyltransferase